MSGNLLSSLLQVHEDENDLLGKLELLGISSAPRSAPDQGVSFGNDENGVPNAVVNKSSKKRSETTPISRRARTSSGEDDTKMLIDA